MSKQQATKTSDEGVPENGVPADLLDERLVRHRGLAGTLEAFLRRVRGGDLGSLPVIVGLIIISLVFYSQEATFLSSRTLVNITLFAAPIGIIAIGVVLVLLLGEIDLSVGSVSGLAASILAVLVIYTTSRCGSACSSGAAPVS